MKVKISYIWLPYLLLLKFLPFGKITLFIFLILTIHELSHMVMAQIFHYKIERVIIYPFGLAAHIPDMGKGNVLQEMMILAAGPMSQVIIPLLCRVFLSWDWISIPFFEYICSMNASIMIFNLLPIYPLDGGRILQCFLHCFLRFQKANIVTYVMSFVFFLLLLYTQLLQGIGAIVLLFFIAIQLFVALRQLSYTTLQFYHYRWRHPVSYKPIINNQRDLYRARYNVMKTRYGIQKEEEWMDQMFHLHHT